ncbi:SGNH/GDSL hydrolase family protein [Streptomyces sp. MZ04]|uniref:SGNH/GDSL hydrolase family protein n=1 Tax=Streptomyces sp. MZ04 TaxID=2559236 RepID=UPI00107E97F0|nr:SGNH/GDSL hydrolase family protein [Streptomyces sp. MZ04]TGB14902.1 SGNH/GDSL hydrolase family protein [Streptomyces sp. MZ04]
MFQHRRRLAAAASALAAAVALTGLTGNAEAATPNKDKGKDHNKATEPQSQSQSQSQEYVAMGDSFSAGPLILPQSDLLTCARSSVNYPALLAERLKVDTTRFRDVTCSSAQTENFANPQPGNVSGTAAPQYDALSKDTTLVTVGIGGNDIGLVGLVQACTNFLSSGAPCKDKFTEGGVDQYAQKIDTFASTYGTVIEKIHERAPRARILMVGYPTGFKPGGCHPYVPLLGEDADYVQANMDRLNRRMAEQAALHGATYVDLRTPSIGHDACQSASTKWIEGLFPSVINNGFAPFHPNAEGMRQAVPTIAAAADAPTYTNLFTHGSKRE